ncbi:NEDD4 family-interacting protein 1-like isoform X2 [Eriocheir sinensis]|uniref:NEDD4 family-interacting protein 1-like isoform X2 n=1 Tax=Eriocheir sinensis TaxID=95602 RepID=UPI0021C631EB|nr:NEDD4 family-interacting protein 1-like isoform X2 [Eriocheir sinensis]
MVPLSEEDHSGSMSAPTAGDHGEEGAVGSGPPPDYSPRHGSSSTTSGSLEDIPPPKPDMHAPPPYEESDPGEAFEGHTVPTFPPDSPSDLQPPSYEEVQRLKALEAAEDYPLPLCHGGGPLGGGSGGAGGGSAMRVLRVSSLGGLDPETAEIAEEQLLGTDFMFFVAFAAAFVFNWVGFVLLLCFCHTVAGRTGALAGFGLSLAKWAVIVRHSTDLVADSNTWLLWLIMALGMLICMRAILQYVHAKREWHQVPHNSRHRFFLFY